jgi:flagellar protein FliO/FliZ
MERIRVIPFAILAALLAVPSRALAAAGGENTPLDLDEGKRSLDSATDGGGPGGGSLVRTLIGLAIVIGVIYGLHWVLKQIKRSSEGKASGAGLATVATLPVGGGRSVQLVRAGRELVLVGVGDHGVTPLRRYTEEEARTLGLVPDDDDDESWPPDAQPPRPGGLRGWVDALRARTVIR